MAGIAGANDPDDAVTFDDLAEFASAFHRSSDFHNSTFLPELVGLKQHFYTKKQKPSLDIPLPAKRKFHEPVQSTLSLILQVTVSRAVEFAI